MSPFLTDRRPTCNASEIVANPRSPAQHPSPLYLPSARQTSNASSDHPASITEPTHRKTDGHRSELQMQSDSPAHCFLIPELLDQVLAHTQQGRFFKLSIRKRLPWKGVCCVSVPVE